MDIQSLQQLLNSQFLGNTFQDYLVSAAVFLGVSVGMPIANRLVLRHLKTLTEATRNDFDDLLHDLVRRFVGPFVYLFTALYFGTLSLSLPENLSRLLYGLFVIILTVKVAQILQETAGYSIRKWTARTVKEDPTSAAMLKPGFPICWPQVAPLYTREPPSARNSVRRTIVQLQRPSFESAPTFD